MIKWALAFMLLALPAQAQRAVMEGVASSRYTIKVDTTNGRVDVATTSYNWGIANVGLHIASNVVVDTLGVHNGCVIYATGSVACLGVNLSSGPATLGISTGVVTDSTMGGNGTASFPLGVNFSTITTLINGLEVSTTTLSASTAALSTRLDAVAVATTTLSASTVTIISLINGLEASTTTLSASTVAIIVLINGLEASTTTLSASTASLRANIVTVGASTQTLSVNVAAATTTLNLGVTGASWNVGTSSFVVAGGSATVAYNLNVGSLGVTRSATVTGTMTVTGSAFSVGTSSFTVSGGSATVAYSLSATSLLATGVSGYDLTLSSGVHFLTATTGIVWQDGSVSTTASSGGGGSVSQAYTTISTGLAAGPFGSAMQRSTITYDATYFTENDDTTNKTTFVSLKSGTAGSGWTRQTFLSGSGTYTTPTGVSQIRVRMVGGGGGGAGDGGGAGGAKGADGTSSNFGPIWASSGTGGTVWATGTGGTCGTGPGGSGVFISSSVVRWPGGGGNGRNNGFYAGGGGGNSSLGGAGHAVPTTSNGNPATTNTGSGGSGGAGGGAFVGPGGAAGETVDIIVNSPSASYSYSVGAGGAGGAGGANAGGAGATGVIIVDELYPPVAAISGTLAPIKDNFISQVTGSQKVFTLSNTPASVAAVACVLDGLTLSASDYTYAAPTTITITTAPAVNSTGFECDYLVNTSTLPAVFILNSSQTVSGNNVFSATSTFSGISYTGVSITTTQASYSSLNVNGWTLVASTHPAGSTTIQFTNIVSTPPAGCSNSPMYEIRGNTLQNTSTGIYEVTFATAAGGVGDTTASAYSWTNIGETDAGSINNAGIQTAFAPVSYSSVSGVIAGKQAVFTFAFQPKRANDHVVLFSSDMKAIQTNNNFPDVYFMSGNWPTTTNIGPLKAINIFVTAGSYTGDIGLWLLCTN